MVSATNSETGQTTSVQSAPDSAARRHLVAAAGFLALGAVIAILASIKLAFPTVFDAAPVAGYARLRPMAFNLLVHGFGFCFVTSVTYYLLPRLSGARLPLQPLANLNLVAAVGVVLVGVAGIGLGYNSGGDLAEFGIVLDIIFLAVTLVPAAIVTLAVLRRRENTLYPSMWFLAGAQLLYPALYLIGSLWRLDGVGNHLQNTFMVGGLLTVVLPAAAIAAVYYLVPKESDQPLYSRPMAMAGFWTLLFAGLATGQTRFVGGPAPDWLDTVGAVLSLGLLITALTVAANVWFTLDGSWERVRDSAALRLTLAGVGAHLVVSGLFAVQGFRAVAAIVGLTVWYDTLMLATLLGSITLLAAGFAYHAYPRMIGRSVFSMSLAMRHLHLTAWGAGLTIAVGVLTSFVMGMTWSANVVSGAARNVGEGFVTSMGSIRLLLTVGTLPVLAAASGAVLFASNVVRTLTSGSATTTEILAEVGDE